MAESSSAAQSSEITSKESNTPGENGGSICSAKAGTRVMKRPRDEKEDSKEGHDDSEPEEKRGSFRLNPPTLIHGQAKPAPKEEEAPETGQKRNFLRPSILSAPATTLHPVSTSASESVNGKSVPSISQVPILGTGLLLPGQVPSNNPFLRTTGNEEEQEKEPKQDFLFQNTIEQRNRENGGDADVSGSDQYAKVNGAKENTFLQMSNQQPTSSTTDDDKTKTESGGFVFGSKMEERVVKNEADSTSGSSASQSSDTKTDGSDFLFGKNLSDRVKVSSADSTNTTLATAPAESVIFHDSTTHTTDGVSSSSRKLEEDAAALFAASNTKPVMPEVEVKTGEEDEKNVLQILCKLFQYDSTNSKNWVERGRGHLRLNDKRSSSTDQKFESRLVMRTHGSLRLILNTKIWPTMVVDRASQKSVRISAQNEDGDIGMYLLQATINDAEQICRAVEYRVLHLKQIQEREEAIKKASESASEREAEVSSTESDQTNTKELEVSPDPADTNVSSSDAVPESDTTTTTIKSSKADETGETETSADSGSGAGDNTTTTTATEPARTTDADKPGETDNPPKHESESTTQADATEQKADTKN